MAILANNLVYLRSQRTESQQEIAKMLGISRQSLGGYETGRAEPKSSVLKKIASFYQVSVDALIEVDLQKSKDSVLFKKSITADELPNKIALVPVPAQAGYAIACEQRAQIEDDLLFFSLPYHQYTEFRAFEISGDSMLPIKSGSIVVCERVEQKEDIKSGKRYIVVSKNNGVVFKRVYKEEKCLILTSDNPEYAPYTIRNNELLEIWQFFSFIEFAEKGL